MFLAMASNILFQVPAWRRRVSSLWPIGRVSLRLLAPALCDLFGSWFIFSGALWVPASVVEMMGCLNTIFTAILSSCLLQKKLVRHEIVGIVLSILGVCCVGAAEYATEEAGKGDDEGSGSGFVACGMMLIAC